MSFAKGPVAILGWLAPFILSGKDEQGAGVCSQRPRQAHLAIRAVYLSCPKPAQRPSA